jgi:uncharacterized membrane protein YraQ (UPF0718 family)
MRLFNELTRALLDAGSMTWQITWSLILGFTLSAVIQAVVRREAIARNLGTRSTRTLALATGLGAASSSCSYAAVALARALVRRGASFTAAMAFEIAILPILIIYRKYYGTKMMLTLLAIFYATMVAGGYLIEFTFGGLGLVPADRAAKVTDTGITWNYTTILNIIFLLVAAALLVRFFRSGGAPMLKAMGGSPDGQQHTRDHSEVPHRGARSAPQSLQAQVSDHQDTIVMSSMGMAPAQRCVRETKEGWRWGSSRPGGAASTTKSRATARRSC